MADAARTYEDAGARRTQHRYADVEVIEGQGKRRRRPQGLPLAVVRGFRVAMLMAVFLCAVGCVRVWLMVSTVELEAESETLASQISVAEKKGVSLEAQRTELSSDERIAEEAAKLGMSDAGGDAVYFDMAKAKEVLAAAEVIESHTPQTMVEAPTVACAG